MAYASLIRVAVVAVGLGMAGAGCQAPSAPLDKEIDRVASCRAVVVDSIWSRCT